VNGEFTAIIEMIERFGWAIVFFYLYWQERRLHRMTREQQIEDYREMAGLKARLLPPQKENAP